MTSFKMNKAVLGNLVKEFRGKVSAEHVREALSEANGRYALARSVLLRRTNQVQQTREECTIVLESPARAEAKKRHLEEINKFHKLKKSLTGDELLRLEQQIDRKVIEWNKKNELRPNYFDCHGMTRGGAVLFARRMLERHADRTLEHKVFEFETGQGHHSKDKVPVIKEGLLGLFNGSARCRAVPKQHNPGVIVVTFC
ncbi:unnamed protein product [Caenorhabditis sp. 36 PRJEB53466]|nr:unnamed protein product [Caenorhabditis sp. 36 PRJEB53466]